MSKAFFFVSLASMMLAGACAPQNLKSSQESNIQIPAIASKTPFIISTTTETKTPLIIPAIKPTVKQSATPFPENKSEKGTTDDGKWEISTSLGGYDSTTQVRSVDGKTVWVLDETTLPDSKWGQLVWYKTSNDNNSVFFELAPYVFEDIILDRWPSTTGLYKLGLVDGKIETILKPRINSSGQITDGYLINGYFKLSPDESQMVYFWWSEPNIILRNLATLDEQIVSLPDHYKIAGPFVWSLDAKSVIFTMWSSAWEYPTDFVLARMDISDKAIHYLYSDNEKNRFFVPIEWTTDNIVYLVDRRVDYSWQINPYTGKLQQDSAAIP